MLRSAFRKRLLEFGFCYPIGPISMDTSDASSNTSAPLKPFLRWAGGKTNLKDDLTGLFCTSGSEREFTLEGSWYADQEIQAGADRDAAAAG